LVDLPDRCRGARAGADERPHVGGHVGQVLRFGRAGLHQVTNTVVNVEQIVFTVADRRAEPVIAIHVERREPEDRRGRLGLRRSATRKRRETNESPNQNH
jgi:hypothetical protein